MSASTLLRCLGPKTPKLTYAIGAGAFLRVLGLAHLFAFGSLWRQIEGLVGFEGVLPAGEWLAFFESRLGLDAWWRVPTVFWFSASDTALLGVCGLGIVTALLLVAGVFERWMLLVGWILYLSLCSVGRVFLAYQWDALLLEATASRGPLGSAGGPITCRLSGISSRWSGSS